MEGHTGERVAGVLPGFERPWRHEPTQVIDPVDGGSPDGQTRLKRKRRRRDRRAIVLVRTVVTLVSGVVLSGVGYGWYMMVWLNGMVTNVAALDPNSSDVTDPAAQAGDENFILVGSDSRAGVSKDEHVGDKSSVPGARSDTLMVIHIPADKSRVVVVSFPRDLQVHRPRCNGWNPYTGKQVPGRIVAADDHAKVNTAYALGGPQCVTKTVQKLTRLKINHYIEIDFNGFRNMVDAVGGVTVHLNKPLVDKELGRITDKAGTVGLTGNQALSFVRARKVKGDPTGDYGRIKRQQQFISSLLTKTMSGDVMFSPDKLRAFSRAFADSTVGENIDVPSMLTLGQSLEGMQDGAIEFRTVPTRGTNGLGNESLDSRRANELFHRLIYNRPLPRR